MEGDPRTTTAAESSARSLVVKAIFDAANPANPILINSNTSIVAYDVIEHPSIPNRILTTSDFGLSQYEVNAATMEIIFLSEIAY